MNRLVLAALIAAFGLACGGSDQAPSNAGGGGSGEDASAAGGSSGSSMGGAGGSSTGGNRSEGGIDFDVIPIFDGAIGACQVCIRDMCQSDLQTCAADPVCLQGVTCSIAMCAQYVMGGQAGPMAVACFTSCFNGDITKALSAVSGLTCVTTRCSACTALLEGGAPESGVPDGGSAVESGAAEGGPSEAGAGD